jgi:phosphinothricin acetyltransferase
MKQMADLNIRLADKQDLARLVEIYNYYVSHTHVTFHIQPLTVATRLEWFRQFAAAGPYRLLVGIRNQQVVGYASSTEFKAKEAYRSSVETTIYVDHQHTGQGIGAVLYSALLGELVAEPSVHRAYGGVALPNESSVELHQRLGFKQVALFSEVGFKFDKYWDVVWFEKQCI